MTISNNLQMNYMISEHFRNNSFHLPLLKDDQTFKEHDVALSQKGLEQVQAGTIHQSRSDLVWALCRSVIELGVLQSFSQHATTAVW